MNRFRNVHFAQAAAWLLLLCLCPVTLESGPGAAARRLTATQSPVALPNLQGGAAASYLKEQGLYASLAAAMTAARYQAYPLPAADAFQLANPAQAFRAVFSADEVRVIAAADEKQRELGFRLTGYGYGARRVPLTTRGLTAHENRVEYTHTVPGAAPSEIKEWYVNQPAGLEQGFTLDAPPPVTRAGEPLQLALALRGDARVALAADGQSIALAAGRAQGSLRYGALAAWDACGTRLAARLRVEPGAIVLEVEDGGATYPLTIDPLLTQQTKLTANDGAAGDGFGAAVGISGNTAVVGASGDDVLFANQGSVYVFVRSGTLWSQQARLNALDAAAEDSFGQTLALSGDTVLAGARNALIGANANQGAVYVFVRNGTIWSQQTKLTAADGAAEEAFGNAVALEGETAVIGSNATVGANIGQGAAYVFVRSGTNWTQQQKLTANDGAAGDLFGFAVALSGNTAVAGATGANIGPNADQGAAYVFVRNGTTWTQQAKLSAFDGLANDNLGWSVAVSGNTALAGARNDDIGTQVNQGSAYVFVRGGTSWTQQAQLSASDGAGNARFGGTVALSGDTAVVGAPAGGGGNGAAYIYARSGASWTQQNRLIAADGVVGDFFGAAVALSGDTVVVGASSDSFGANTAQGSAYVFVICDNLVERQKLTASDGAASDAFGVSVALSGETVVVGAYADDIGVNVDQGSAYVFVRSGTNPSVWTQQQKLTASDGAAGDSFGYSVALSGETVVVGSPSDDVGANANQGSAYVFVRSGTNWTQQQKLTASNGAANDDFGMAVALNGETAVVGAPFDDVSFDGGTTFSADAGSIYVFGRNGTTWSQQGQFVAFDGLAFDTFGIAVALSGDAIVIGASKALAGRGAVYVYSRNGGPPQKLTASDGAAGDFFGYAVALSDNTLVVGAYSDDSGGNVNQGSAYVFVRNGTNWTQQQKLTASDGAAGDSFGSAVALSDDTMVIGAVTAITSRGAAYIFMRNGANWSQQQRLAATDGAANDAFGIAVALSGGIGVVGAYVDDIGANGHQGSAYVFTCQACPALTFTPASLPNGVLGTSYQQSLTVTGGTGPYQFALAAGPLPPGLTLAQNGVLSGTPVTAGTYSFTVTATAANFCPGSRSYTLVITPPCPAITVNPANPALPGGTAGQPYSQTFTATGGTPGYSFAVTSGALPAGLNLSAGGVLSGSPTQTGAFNFTINATDSQNCSGARAYTLTVNCQSLTVNPASLPAARRGVPYSQSFTQVGGVGTLAWMLTGALPAGLSFNAATALLTGTPTVEGSFNFAVTVTDAAGCNGARNYTLAVLRGGAVKADFDGDGRTDLSVWRGPGFPAAWLAVLSSNNTLQNIGWGTGQAPYFDVPVPGDYDGDGKTDQGIWRGQDTLWYIRPSSTGQPFVRLWGANYAPYFDVPTPGDFDGDGKTDIAVWRPTDSTFYVRRSSDNGIQAEVWGANGDTPVVADYDRDGKSDYAVWRPSTGDWLIKNSGGGTQSIQWGAGYAPYFDVPVVADYDGDGKADPAIWRGQDSLWYIRQSSNNQPFVRLWGANYAPYFDVPVPGDYDGDGKADIAVWRPADGNWYVIRSTTGTFLVQQHGQQGDTPVPASGVR